MDEVLIVGAGPTGLVLALWLTRQGIGVRIVDASPGPGTTSRAMVVHARTLELYRQLDLADVVVAAGRRTPAMNMWARGRHRARVALGDIGTGLSPYPFVLALPQDRHERLLAERLTALGITVERDTELLRVHDAGDHVQAVLRLPDGREQACAARYLAGCDGARSAVRQQLGIGFDGGTYRQVFYVADADVAGLQPAGEAHIAFGGDDFLLAFPYDGTGRCRLIGTVQGERAECAETLAFADVQGDAIAGLGLEVTQLHWFSTYRAHHRVAQDFARGRVFLLGDAAHIHSPVGGQGMNTGIGDAINLAWKLADVLRGRASETLLDSYAQERQGFARTLVDTTDLVFTFVTAQGGLANSVRTHVAPAVFGYASRMRLLRVGLFRRISQIMIDYRGSVLSEGRAGRVEGGDRLPWVKAAHSDNHASLTDIAWQVHVYGEAGTALRRWCEYSGIGLHAYTWCAEHGHAGLRENAAYLLRPDGHVALADAGGDPRALADYMVRHGYAQGVVQM